METKVLVLTSWYMPIQIVSWQDAITDLYLEKTEVLASYTETVSSPSTTLRIPAVVRVKRHTNRIKRGIKFSRENVATRDGFRCQYCLQRFPLRQLTYDHVFPRSRGGETTWENVVCACRTCNSKKDDNTPQEAGMVLHTVPRRPHTLPLEPLRVSGHIPPEWDGFVAPA
jgi:5-methylcytosine-specific restriction endonuclease McrA